MRERASSTHATSRARARLLATVALFALGVGLWGLRASLAADDRESHAPPSLPAANPEARHEEPAGSRRGLRDPRLGTARAASPPAAIEAPDWSGLLVQLSPEEQRLVDQYDVTGLGTAIAEAENAYITASAATRAEADRRYLLVTNLAAKLMPPPAPPAPVVLRRQAEYQRVLPAEMARVAHLPESEREVALSKFKDAFFQVDLETPPESEEHINETE